MKAKLKDGRILPIEKGSVIALDNNGDTFEVNVNQVESFLNESIDWEQRRYETAKDVLAAFMSNSCSNVFVGSKENQAKDAVEYADALINELKKTKQ